MSSTDRIVRSRGIRRQILSILHLQYSAGMAAVGYSVSQLTEGMCSVLDVDPYEVEREMGDLVDERLVERRMEDGPRYCLTADGADFVKAGYPWDAIDRFTGKTRPEAQ